MKRNLGSLDRSLRIFAALGLGVAALFSPLAALIRFGVFGPMAVYMLSSALYGACCGYRLLGLSTCSLESRR